MIDKKSIKISKAHTRAKVCTPMHSFVILTFQQKQLFMASELYKKSKKNSEFYNQWNINENISLTSINHGGDKDTPELTMPLFLKAAAQIHTALNTSNKILVNCHHGRSRSGTVIALYFMEYAGLSADDAIEVVTKALAKRGYEGGIDIKGSCSGNYGDWLRDYEKQKVLKEDLEYMEDTTQLANDEGPRRSKRLAENHTFFAPKKARVEVIDSLNSNRLSL